MALLRTRGKTKRSGSGGRYIAYRKPKLYELSVRSVLTKVGELKSKSIRTQGGRMKKKLLDSNKINLLDPKSDKYSIADVETVVECPANSQYVRRNIITKGTIVQTNKGRARITSKPGQTGMLNGVLIQ